MGEKELQEPCHQWDVITYSDKRAWSRVTTLSSLAQNYPVFLQILLVYPTCPQIQMLKVQKTQYFVLCQVLCGTDTMSIKIPEEYFIETVKLILKCVWWRKRTRSWNDFWGVKRWAWKSGTTWFRTLWCKPVVTSTTLHHVHIAKTQENQGKRTQRRTHTRTDNWF